MSVKQWKQAATPSIRRPSLPARPGNNFFTPNEGGTMASVSVVFFDLGDTLVSSVTTQWLPGATDTLSKLKQKGIRLGIISNTGDLDRADLQPLLPSDFDFNLFAAN